MSELLTVLRNGITPEKSLEDFLRAVGPLPLKDQMKIILCRPSHIWRGQATPGEIIWDELLARPFTNQVIAILEQNGAVILQGMPGDTRELLFIKLRLRLAEIEETEALLAEAEGKEPVQ